MLRYLVVSKISVNVLLNNSSSSRLRKGVATEREKTTKKEKKWKMWSWHDCSWMLNG